MLEEMNELKLISGILIPDIKGLLLQSMNSTRFCTSSELYHQLCKFCDFSPEEFPIKNIGNYLQSLTSIGAVAWHIKTDFGREYGDPLVARGTFVVNSLTSKIRSLYSIFGRSLSSKIRLIKLLAINPREKFEVEDVKRVVKMSRETFNFLGSIGIIDSNPRYISANENTLIIYRELLEPLEKAVSNLDLYDSGFKDRYEYYLNREEEWRRARKNQVLICGRELRMCRYEINSKGYRVNIDMRSTICPW
jgi:hypothetical protein